MGLEFGDVVVGLTWATILGVIFAILGSFDRTTSGGFSLFIAIIIFLIATGMNRCDRIDMEKKRELIAEMERAETMLCKKAGYIHSEWTRNDSFCCVTKNGETIPFSNPYRKFRQ